MRMAIESAQVVNRLSPRNPPSRSRTRRSASCAKSSQRSSSAPRAVSTLMSPVTRTSRRSRRAASPSAPSSAIARTHSAFSRGARLIWTTVSEQSWSGGTAPSFTLPDAQGKQVSLDSLLKEGRVVIAFYRGQWCPYCDLQLRAYQEVLPRIKALGANLVAISPQTPDESLSTAEKRKLEFRVLSDAGNKVARGYGLVWKVPAGLDAIQKGFGVNLTKSDGDASNELPVPGTFVLGADGRIALSRSE